MDRVASSDTNRAGDRRPRMAGSPSGPPRSLPVHPGRNAVVRRPGQTVGLGIIADNQGNLPGNISGLNRFNDRLQITAAARNQNPNLNHLFAVQSQ